jgi:hypothetical protein
MNIKTFYIIKAFDILPSDLKYYIYQIIKNEAALCIQKLYTFKIAKNIDIFKKIMSISNYENSYSLEWVDKYIKYSKNNITYTYIQEPGTWIEHLGYIANSMYRNSRCFQTRKNIRYMMNGIKNSNKIYIKTGIEYWNYF